MFEQVEVKSKIFNKVAFDKHNARMLGWAPNGMVLSVNGLKQEVYDGVVAAEDQDAALSAALQSHNVTPVMVPAHNPRLVGFPPEVQSYLEHNFKYHSPNELQQKVYEAIRSKAKEFAAVILANAPEGSERDFAMHYLKMAVMSANQAVAFNPLDYDPVKKEEVIKKYFEQQAAAKLAAEGKGAPAPEVPPEVPRVEPKREVKNIKKGQKKH